MKKRARDRKKWPKKCLWDWENRMRTHYTLKRPDVTWQDKIKKEIFIVHIECQRKWNKQTNKNEKIEKYQQLYSEQRDRRQEFKGKIIPLVIRCRAEELKNWKVDKCNFLRNKRIEKCTNITFRLIKMVDKLANETWKTLLW